jgi:hypothetical protein
MNRLMRKNCATAENFGVAGSVSFTGKMTGVLLLEYRGESGKVGVR